MFPRRFVVLSVIGVAASACRPREASRTTPPASTASPAPPVEASDAASDPSRLVGRWLRSDSDYAIAIAAAAPDGKLDAQYLNPNPIHVSKAEWRRVGGSLAVVLELTDRNYPG